MKDELEKTDEPRLSGREHELGLAAMGLEAEFNVLLDGQPAKPEDVFKTPLDFVRDPLMHRKGRSYHLPTGGAIYFDTGVIEVTTPVIEIDRGCSARAGRSLWEGILYIREELDAWEKRTGRTIRLVGFSTHYNVSFELPRARQGRSRTVTKLAHLLSFLLPPPVMLLATNRRSTGVGVRPRGNRVEVTVDFTPDPALMIATGALLTGIIRSVMTWSSFELSELDRRGLPRIKDFVPGPHTSRKGWLAKFDNYPANPFTCDIDEVIWELDPAGSPRGSRMALREMARTIARRFWRAIARVADPFTFRLIDSVMSGRSPSMLDLDDRPPAYEDVGRRSQWGGLFPVSRLSRSRYETVLLCAMAGRKLRLGSDRYTPTGMRGWTDVVFTKEGDPQRHVFSIDYLLDHQDAWES